MFKMKLITKIKTSRLLGCLFLTALTTAAVSGCGAADGETTDGVAEESAVAGEAPAGAATAANAAAEDDVEKALRRDFCCAVKTGNYVEYCVNFHLTKVGATLQCSFGDNVLRDGQCSQYESCRDIRWRP